jgi:hypothetical protein
VQKEKKDDYVLLEGVAQELEEDGRDTMQESTPLLSCATLEKVLVDRLSMDQQSIERQIKGKDKTDVDQGNYLEYLVSCFRIGTLTPPSVRLVFLAGETATTDWLVLSAAAYYDSERSINKGNKQRVEVFKHVFDLVVSYAGLILMYPDTWPQTMTYATPIMPVWTCALSQIAHLLSLLCRAP